MKFADKKASITLRLKQISILVVILCVAALPLCLWALFHIPIGSADVHQWLPQNRPERQEYDDFLAAFGDDHDLLISWDQCRLGDSRLVAFYDQIRAVDSQSIPSFAETETSETLLRKLTDPPLRLSEREAKKRLKGFLLGADGTAVVLIHVTEHGNLHQNESISKVLKAADNTPGLGSKDIRIAGSVYEAFAIDQSAESSLRRLVLPSSLLGLLVAWMSLRGFKKSIVILLLAGFGQLLSVATVYFTGLQFSAVLIVLPTLVFMLTLSGAVHLVFYYDDCLRTTSDAGVCAVMIGWKPCALSSITTMIGMGSLLTSDLAPVRQFGLYSAFCLGIATVVLLLAFPAMMDFVLRPGKNRDLAKSNTSLRFQNFIDKYVGWIAKYSTVISVAGIAALVLTFLSLSQLESSTKFCDMFSKESKTSQDMAWLEEHIGPISTVEVLLRFAPTCTMSSFERAEWISRVSTHLRKQPEVGSVLSALTFLPNWSDSGSIGQVAKRAAIRKALENNLDQLYDKKLIASTDLGQVWRVIARVSAVNDVDYGTLTQKVSYATDEIVKTAPSDLGLSAICTGLTPVMHETQVSVLTDLGFSFLSAFLLITPVMMWVTRSFLGGLLIMIPNILPVTLVFGTMGLLGFSLDIAGILTASIALGIAVDDTLHFICRYVQILSVDPNKKSAIIKTFVACSPAMVSTTLISCLAMSPFLFAEFMPTGQFAKLMIAMLLGAIVGDLVLLPSLLLSPLGKAIHSIPEKLSKTPT